MDITRIFLDNSHDVYREMRQSDKAIMELATRAHEPIVRELLVDLLNEYNNEVVEAHESEIGRAILKEREIKVEDVLQPQPLPEMEDVEEHHVENIKAVGRLRPLIPSSPPPAFIFDDDNVDNSRGPDYDWTLPFTHNSTPSDSSDSSDTSSSSDPSGDGSDGVAPRIRKQRPPISLKRLVQLKPQQNDNENDGEGDDSEEDDLEEEGLGDEDGEDEPVTEGLEEAVTDHETRAFKGESEILKGEVEYLLDFSPTKIYVDSDLEEGHILKRAILLVYRERFGQGKA